MLTHASDDSRPVVMADRSSYQVVLINAQLTGVAAIHPGYYGSDRRVLKVNLLVT